MLCLAVNFGQIGVVSYCSYVWLAMREIAKAAEAPDLRRGIFVGMILILAWGLVEIIVLTPAFELLLAALYIFAVNRNSGKEPA